MNYTAHSLRLQDGTLLNLRRRVKKHKHTFLPMLASVGDGRSDQGKRHPIENILLTLFCATMAGCAMIIDCWRWMIANRWWLKRYLELAHGIPHPTTISAALAVCDIGSLVSAWYTFRVTIYSASVDQNASMDRKTMRGVTGSDVIRHILSLFVHETHQTIGQVGVSQKENESPAAKRMLQKAHIFRTHDYR